VCSLVYWRLAFEDPAYLANAIECYEAALAVNPRHLANWCNLADLFLQASDVERAREAAERAVEIGPHDPVAQDTLARVRTYLREND